MKELLQFCETEAQRNVIECVIKHKSQRKAAKELGKGKSTIQSVVDKVRHRAALRGFSPDHNMTHIVPEGYLVKGTSTYYDVDGQVRGQWVKSSVDEASRHDLLKAAYEAMADDLPRLEPVLSPSGCVPELLNLYTLTDSHVGALAWHKEGGADWDLKIAERTIVGCFTHMILNSPKAHTGFVCQLGDFLHSDGITPVTPTSGHVLDQDGRFTKVVQVAVHILRAAVNLALTRHERVVVLMAEGNHDISSSIWLRTMFKALYENEPRVEVLDSPLPYYVYSHGKTMLGFHHGHLKKNDQLPILFASQFPAVWGSSTKRYVHTGHRHHTEVKEHSGITVHQHPTLAARDAYAARGGWIAERQVTSVTYHKEFGQVAQNTVTPEMLE